MKTYTFKVVLEPDQDAEGNPAWHAYCPALVGIGAATSGRTKEEALARINELVHMIVEEFIEEGRSLTARELVSALERDGFYFVRQRGSHKRYRHPDGRRVTVAPHAGGDTFSVKTLQAIVEIQ
jgi:predicted RNA binding protein YcfA (HicA-like mRNA interferase family)